MSNKPRFRIGIDIGGTKMEVALLVADQSSTNVIPQFKVIRRERIPTLREEGIESLLLRLSQLISTMATEEQCSLVSGQDPNGKFVESIGIGLPGSVHPRTFIMQNGNTQILKGVDLRHELKTRLNFKNQILVANDANCFALAETLLGAGKYHQEETGVDVNQTTAIGIILGTGVGGGIIIKGKMLEGKSGGGGEIGHFSLSQEGPVCYCGRRGCSELYLSGRGIEERFYERHGVKMGEKIKSHRIFELYDQKNPEAQEFFNFYFSKLDQFFLDLINIFDPDFLVLGGGVSLQPLIYQGLEQRLASKTFIPNNNLKIYRHALGDSAGVIGAGLLGLL